MGDVLANIEVWADRAPEKRLYSFLDAHGDEVEGYSYADFLRRVEIIASHLRCGHGFAPGSRLVLAYPPGLEMISAFFGSARAGLIPVPVAAPTAHGFSPALHRLAYVARDCEATAVLSTTACRAMARAAADGHRLDDGGATALDWIATDAFVQPAGQVARGPCSDVLFLQYTSGSTSNPKGVVVTHDNVLANFKLVLDHPTPVGVTWLPHHHDMGLIGYYIYAPLAGATLHAFSPTTFIKRPGLWLETISKHRATASSAPNFAFEYCLRPGRIPKAVLDQLDLSSLKILMCAAEPVRPGVYQDFLRTYAQYGLNSKSFFVSYGLAENTVGVSGFGREILSVNKRALRQGRVKVSKMATNVGTATHIISCGRPLGDNRVAIVDPEPRLRLADDRVGEIWVAGASKCRGYWNKPAATQEVFDAQIADADSDGEAATWLRTGDLGFLHNGELYLCGRRKDMIIVRGQNFYPQDIEAAAEKASAAVRRGCVAAFEVGDEGAAEITVVAETAGARAPLDGAVVAAAVRNDLGIDVGKVVFVRPRSLPKTSSGKIMRFKARQMLLAGEFEILSTFTREKSDAAEAVCASAPFAYFKTRYGLAGDEPFSLIDAGLDSLDLVLFLHELAELLAEKGAAELGDQVDIGLIQQLSVASLFRLAARLETAPETAIAQVSLFLRAADAARRDDERSAMVADSILSFEPAPGPRAEASEPPRSVLLTGGTGLLGPFLLTSLLEQTEAAIRVLVRSTEPREAAARLKAAVEAAAPRDAAFWRLFESRVVPVCGDLEQPRLGLDADTWRLIAEDVDTVYHNAAAVNYLFNYNRMRAANVVATDELLRLSFESRRKVFNHMSTTFIFGWTPKDVLYEAQGNALMQRLDFGYSQSKWVAEQLVADAGRRGLATRIFRPSLITPSLAGRGANFDITLRLLAFMIKHGIGVDALNQISFTPAEVAANNIVAVSNLPWTANGVFHVTCDDYANMGDITEIITRLTGRRFEPFELSTFVSEMIIRCTKEDLLFPLLDFVVGAVDDISAMERKRYDSTAYRRARGASPWGRPDPPLEQTVAGILRFMQRTGLSDLAIREAGKPPREGFAPQRRNSSGPALHRGPLRQLRADI